MGAVKNNNDNCAPSSPVSIFRANKMTIAVNEVPKNVTGGSKSSNNASSSKEKKKKKKVCLCAPTTHPGSFKCRHHRSVPSSKDHESGRNVTTKQSHINVESKTGLSRFGRPAAASRTHLVSMHFHNFSLLSDQNHFGDQENSYKRSWLLQEVSIIAQKHYGNQSLP